MKYTWTESLKQAKRQDFIIKTRGVETPNFGKVFFLRSLQTKIIEGPYLLDRQRSMANFKEWLENNMVYIRDNS